MQRMVIILLATISVGLAILNVLEIRARNDSRSDDKVIEVFRDIFLLRDAPDRKPRAPRLEVLDQGLRIDRVFGKNQWLGVTTLQNPLDVWITQEIIHEVKPDFIVETGTWHGGSALLWASILQEVNRAGRVITVDIEDLAQEARLLPIWARMIESLVGSSTDPEIVSEIKRRAQGKRVMVILDALHTRDHVLAELRAYAPLVDVGSYIIVQDTGFWKAHEYTGWAHAGVEAFLGGTDAFEVDRSRERFLLTSNPGGYLRRVQAAYCSAPGSLDTPLRSTPPGVERVARAPRAA